MCFPICKHTAVYKGEELIRDVSEGIQRASNTAFYIALWYCIVFTMVEPAHYILSEHLMLKCQVVKILFQILNTVFICIYHEFPWLIRSFNYYYIPTVCSSAQLPAAPGNTVVWWVPRMETTSLGSEACHLLHHWPALPCLLSHIPSGSKEHPGNLHQETFHQVHLPHCLLPDLPLPPPPRLTAYRANWPACTGTSTHHRGVDDLTLGSR